MNHQAINSCSLGFWNHGTTKTPDAEPEARRAELELRSFGDEIRHTSAAQISFAMACFHGNGQVSNDLWSVKYTPDFQKEGLQSRLRDSNPTAMAELTHMIDSEVFLAFSTYATVVVLKMMLMSPMTAYFRFTRKCFANMEDTGMAKTPEDKKRMLRVDPDVERVRRCHQNDLENIIPFIVIGLLYTLTGPDLSTALLHFRVFVGSRLFHTVAYVLPLPQPSRGLAWMVGMGATFSMAYRVLSTTHL